MKVEIDEELWYGASSDEAAEAEASKSMAARMGRIVGAKPFPAAAHRLSQITQDPNCQMDEVVEVLESDPALSARLLRLVNSVGFSLRTACTSVRHAAALVGTEKLNQVASTAAILDMYESGGERARELLEHATVVGTLCRYLAFHFGLPPDELFTCGFLHDIGKLMLLDTEGSDYLEVLGKEIPDFDLTHIEERKRFGFDHALLAGHVLAAWNIPHPVPKVVAWHHHVTRAYAESTTISQMVSTLRLADAMSFALKREDTQVQIETLARMEAASYMDISEGQLAAMWEEVRALTERARAVFRGEEVPETQIALTSRPSGASLRAVARAKNSERVSRNSQLGTSQAPSSSERTRTFPCVACGAPSYAHRCSACHGYMCPLHIANEDEWCQLCQSDYDEAGIPSIRPIVSTLFGALAGALVAAAFFGAASAGAQRPLRIMIGPTLILMLLGMLAGIGQRWIRRWWFLRSRPSRASIIPKAVETVLDSAAQQNPQIVEIGASEPAEAGEAEAEAAAAVMEEVDPRVAKAEQLSLMNPDIPGPPGMPHLDTPSILSTPPRSSHPRERTWMSSRTPHPSAVADRLALSSPPSGLPREDEEVPSRRSPPAEAEPYSRPAPSIQAIEATDAEAAEATEAERTRVSLAVEADSKAASQKPAEPAQNEPAAAAVAETEETEATEAEAEAMRASDEEQRIEELPEVAAAQSAGGSRGSMRSGGSVRPPASESRPSSRSERLARSRASGSPRAVSDRPTTRGLSPSSIPAPSQRQRPSSPPSQRPSSPPGAASVRPRVEPTAAEASMARSAAPAARSAPAAVRSTPAPASVRPAPPPARSAAPASTRSAPASARSAPVAAPTPESIPVPVPRPWVPPSLNAPTADDSLAPLDATPQNDADAASGLRPAWSIVDEGTAGGW